MCCTGEWFLRVARHLRCNPRRIHVHRARVLRGGGARQPEAQGARVGVRAEGLDRALQGTLVLPGGGRRPPPSVSHDDRVPQLW